MAKGQSNFVGPLIRKSTVSECEQSATSVPRLLRFFLLGRQSSTPKSSEPPAANGGSGEPADLAAAKAVTVSDSVLAAVSQSVPLSHQPTTVADVSVRLQLVSCTANHFFHSPAGIQRTVLSFRDMSTQTPTAETAKNTFANCKK